MMKKIDIIILIVCLNALAICACDTITSAEEFCSELADTSCDKFFNEDCFTKEERAQFKSQDDCVNSQETECLKVSEKQTSSFDAITATTCITSLKKAKCESFKRGEINCLGVFDDEAPSTPTPVSKGE